MVYEEAYNSRPLFIGRGNGWALGIYQGSVSRGAMDRQGVAENVTQAPVATGRSLMTRRQALTPKHAASESRTVGGPACRWLSLPASPSWDPRAGRRLVAALQCIYGRAEPGDAATDDHDLPAILLHCRTPWRTRPPGATTSRRDSGRDYRSGLYEGL